MHWLSLVHVYFSYWNPWCPIYASLKGGVEPPVKIKIKRISTFNHILYFNMEPSFNSKFPLISKTTDILKYRARLVWVLIALSILCFIILYYLSLIKQIKWHTFVTPPYPFHVNIHLTIQQYPFEVKENLRQPNEKDFLTFNQPTFEI